VRDLSAPVRSEEFASLELLLQLPELGHDVNVAVRAAPVIAVVILMVRLGRVEFGQGDELGHDR